MVSIVVVSYNARRYLRKCLVSIMRYQLPGRTEAIVVDNASSDGSPDMVEKEFPSVILVRNDKNHGFAPACNQGIELSGDKPYVLLLNNDAELLSSSLNRLVSFAEAHPDSGVIGCQQMDTEGKPISASLVIGSVQCHPITPKHHGPYSRAWVSGACMLLRRTACEEVGWLDEELVFGYDDTEVCWRMQRAGWGVYFLSEARVIHHQEKSTGDGFNPYVYMRSRIGLVRVTRKYYPPLVRLILPWWVVAGVGVEAAFSFLNEDRERTKGCIETMRECIRVLS